jgi:hypothetical protein
MAKLSNDINYYYDNAFPVVYRSLNYQGGYLSGQINRLDRVYWENLLGTNIDGKGPRVYAITLRPIDLYDNNNVAVNWNVFSTSIICSQTGKLYQPNITQGYPVPNSGHYGTGLLLDCKLVTSNSSLIELAHDINTLVSPTNPGYYYIEPFNWVKNITSVGNIPHLAMHYNIMDSVHSWLNRRVYNLFDPNPSTIMASAKFAYKEVEDYTVNEGLVGFKSDSSKYFIYLPLLNNQIIGLHLPFMESIDSLGNTQFVRTPCDTIFSDWFTVGDMSTLNFKCKGYDTTKTKIVIQKNSNGQIYNLEIPEFTTDTSGKLCCNILLNGQDNEYRMLMINRDSNSSYSEEVWLGGLPVDTMLFANKAGVTMGYNIVDLGGGANDETLNQNMTLSIHPNPANDVVYINGLLPVSVYLDNGNTNVNHKIKYSVYSQIGCVQMTAEGSPGETVTINTSGLSAGVYFIRAEHSSDIFYNPVSPVMGSFVITR